MGSGDLSKFEKNTVGHFHPGIQNCSLPKSTNMAQGNLSQTRLNTIETKVRYPIIEDIQVLLKRFS